MVAANSAIRMLSNRPATNPASGTASHRGRRAGNAATATPGSAAVSVSSAMRVPTCTSAGGVELEPRLHVHDAGVFALAVHPELGGAIDPVVVLRLVIALQRDGEVVDA